ncbi:unnamed protein product [Adineta steineri]|uniref:Uncharacterized protein n=1 Tax=Adineta steineri TaxID=433720 RepID=A0A814UZA1_9BILA|nr:unnamed protein product [Adineta steineri]CAF3770040.1 unnamed protein product [Adineta steineri]
MVWLTEDEDNDISISLCQIHVQSDELDLFDDRVLLSLLSTLKMHDFQIGQPVWGPMNNRLYLCEHPLKAGLKQSIIDDEFKNIIRNHGESATRFTWSCA